MDKNNNGSLTGIIFLQGYGLTEQPNFCVLNNKTTDGSVGKTLVGADIIIDNQMKTVRRNIN